MVWFIRSVWPSVWGWNDGDSRRFRFIMEARDFQKREVKIDPRSETRDWGMPCRRMTLSRNMRANSGASVVLRQGTRWVIFVRRSTKTRRESNPFDTGKSTIKSQETDFHGPEGAGRGANSPWHR